MPTNSPACTSKLTPASACVMESRVPNTFSIWRTLRMGCALLYPPCAAARPIAAADGVAKVSLMMISF